jgi:spore coat polysaccharide biosynthesis protein SpsF
MGLTGAIIQARVASPTFYGRPLVEIGGEPLISHLVNRIKQTQLVEELVIAATQDPPDKAFIDLALALDARLYRGSIQDALDRFYNAAVAYDISTIVRLTCDCPFVDPYLIDRAIEAFANSDPPIHYLTNTMRRTYPRGLEIEVFSFVALEAAWKETTRAPIHRTQVTTYFRTHPDRFNIAEFSDPVDRSWLRLNIESEQDLAFIRALWAQLEKPRQAGYVEITDFLLAHPELLAINGQRPPA